MYIMVHGTMISLPVIFTFGNNTFYIIYKIDDIVKCYLIILITSLYLSLERYNNNAQYKGNVDRNGAMNGIGTYIFPDESSLIALWSQNKSISDVIYQNPLGYKWITESISENVCILKLQIIIS